MLLRLCYPGSGGYPGGFCSGRAGAYVAYCISIEKKIPGRGYPKAGDSQGEGKARVVVWAP